MLYGRKLLVVYSYLAKIDSHRHCINGCAIILVCHMILKDHVIIGSCDFMGRSNPRYVIFLPRFVALSIVVVEIHFFSLSRYLKKPRDYMVI